MTSQFMPKSFGSHHHHFDISQQQTLSCPVTPSPPLTEQPTQPQLSPIQLDSTTIELPSHEPIEELLDEEIEEKEATKKPGKLRLAIILAIIGLGCTIYFIWRPPATNSSAAPVQSQPSSKNTNKGNSSSSTPTNTPDGTIQVYIAGAVRHPGVYTLSSDARVYQLLQAAGGPLPNADLVALNLAEKLADGDEIYVTRIGETPPATDSTTNNSKTQTNKGNNQGQLVNINSASSGDLRQKLHLSAKSAQEIINYRQSHGPFKSVDELLQAVSKTIYDKIKNMVTV